MKPLDTGKPWTVTLAPTWALATRGRDGTEAVRVFVGDFAERRARLAYADAIADYWTVAAVLDSDVPGSVPQQWRLEGVPDETH